MTEKKVCVIGLWHLGSVTSACLAELGYKIIGYDKDEKRIQNLKKGKAPIFEPNLDSLIKKNVLSGVLQFTTNLKEAVSEANFVLLTIDTPVDEEDNVNLTSVYEIINEISELIDDEVTIIVQSQIPVGTSDEFVEIIRKKRPEVKFGLAYCPENLRLGNAIELFKHPERIIIGADSEATSDKVESFFSILNCPTIKMNLKSAEMTKHAINAFLANCISFINWIGNLCEAAGADVNKVSEGLMSEKRIGKKLPLKAGMGFGGGTLGRDLKILAKLGHELNLKPDLIESILSINHQQNTLIIKKILSLFSSLDGLTIGILGLAYKPGTNTLRRSASIEVIKELLKHNSRVTAFDPAISNISSISDDNFQLQDSAYAVTKDADVLILFTDWPEFKELDFEKIFSYMKNPLIIDMKNFLNDHKIRDLGFTYVGIGIN